MLAKQADPIFVASDRYHESKRQFPLTDCICFSKSRCFLWLPGAGRRNKESAFWLVLQDYIYHLDIRDPRNKNIRNCRRRLHFLRRSKTLNFTAWICEGFVWGSKRKKNDGSLPFVLASDSFSWTAKWIMFWFRIKSRYIIQNCGILPSFHFFTDCLKATYLQANSWYCVSVEDVYESGSAQISAKPSAM